MADDDDVIFEGQELQKYLSEIGCTDFEMASPSSSQPTSPRERSLLPESSNRSNVLNSFCRSASSWISSPWKSDIRLEDKFVLNKHMQLILECGLLFEDDVHFIKNVTPNSDMENEITKETIWNKKALSLASSVSWVGNIWNEAMWPVTGSVLFCILWRWKNNRQNAQHVTIEQHLLLVMRDLYTIFWKSMKLLQENELILRGFTLAKTGSTVSRLENSELPCMVRKWDSSPGLRLALAKALREAIDILSLATQQLITHCPLFGQLDNPSHYMSFLDESALGLLPDNEESNVNLSHLKKLHHVFLVLQSEFLRRLALCFCPELWKWKSLKHMKSVMKTVKNVTKSAANVHSALAKEYHVFYSYGICEKIQDNMLSLPIQKSDIFKSNDAQGALRSASLHLQVLLLNTKTLEEKLQLPNNSEDECFDDVVTHLSNIIQELDVCRSCCEDGIVQIKRLTAPPQTIEFKEEAERNTENLTNGDVKIIHVGYTNLDPQVDDEIFEAVITEDMQEEPQDSYDDHMSNEKLQFEKTMQLSKVMMQELKSVLVIKAEKWKEREEKALQAKQTSAETIQTVSTMQHNASISSPTDTVMPVDTITVTATTTSTIISTTTTTTTTTTSTTTTTTPTSTATAVSRTTTANGSSFTKTTTANISTDTISTTTAISTAITNTTADSIIAFTMSPTATTSTSKSNTTRIAITATDPTITTIIATNVNTDTMNTGDAEDEERNENVLVSEDEDSLQDEKLRDGVRSKVKAKTCSLQNSPHRKENRQKLLHGRLGGSDSYLEQYKDVSLSNASLSSSRAVSYRSPKHVFASETFRPLQNDLQFSVGLHLSSDALAKFQARNIGGTEVFSGSGENSSSEEILDEDS